MATLQVVDELLEGQAEVWKHILAFADSMALKCAVELWIPDIINSHGKPITLYQIASSIDSPSPDLSYLTRIMRLLVRKKIFTAEKQSHGGDDQTLYGLTQVSKLLIRDSNCSLAPMLLMQNHALQMAPWHYFSRCVREGGTAYNKAHGCEIYEFASRNPEFNDIFNDAMACMAPFNTHGTIVGYKDEFQTIGSLVDVGGGTGAFLAEITKLYPHIKGINFDLPHVIATAPDYEGVRHVGGDMFASIPNADSIMMKRIMHNWGDEDCVKILKNCRKAINEETGKIIIVDIVLEPEGDDPIGDTLVACDLLMMAHTSGGQERTESQWKKILEEGGFPRYKIIRIPDLSSIIEAYPA